MKFFRESAETRKAKMLKNAQDGLEQLDLSKWEHLRRPPSKRMKRAYKKSDKKSQREEARDQRVIQKSNELWSKAMDASNEKKYNRLKDKSKIILLKKGII